MDTNQTPTQNNPTPRNNKATVPIAVGVLALLIYGGVLLAKNSDNSTEDNQNQQDQNNNSSNSADPGNSAAGTQPAGETPVNDTPNTPINLNGQAYKDGVYTSTGSYISPGGQESVEVTLTLRNGVVTAHQVKAKAATPTSTRFQTEFVNNYKQYVEGKSIDELNLSKVAGSSLTSRGFNAAVETIKTQARS